MPIYSHLGIERGVRCGSKCNLLGASNEPEVNCIKTAASSLAWDEEDGGGGWWTLSPVAQNAYTGGMPLRDGFVVPIWMHFHIYKVFLSPLSDINSYFEQDEYMK